MTRNEILFTRSLQHRSERLRTGKFIVEGVKGFMELEKSDIQVERIYCVASMVKHISAAHSVLCEIVSPKEMTRISSLKTPPGLLALVHAPQISAQQIVQNVHEAKLPFILLAAGIADPGNMGTLIRTAHWFGMAGVLLTEGSTDPWSPKCVQASMGSIFRVPTATIPADQKEIFGDLPHYALDMNGDDYITTEWKPGVLWVGSESHGIPLDALPTEAHRIAIPRIGEAESLNAGVAGAIVSSEIARVWKA